RELATKEGHKPNQVLHLDDLCSGNDIFFAATGITTGELLKGVRYEDVYAYTQSMVLRSTSGTMRIVDAYHPIEKLRAKGLLPEQVAIHWARPRRDSSSPPRRSLWARPSGSGSRPPACCRASARRPRRWSRSWSSCS